jgi:transposase-like protein
MNILNKKELRRQIRSGEFTSLDNILNEFKDIIREVVQTSTTAELDEHLGYDKHSNAIGGNYRNGHNTQTLKTTYGNIDVVIFKDRNGSLQLK